MRGLLKVSSGPPLSSFQQYATLLAPIWWWRGQRPRGGGETPLFDVGFDEHEAELAKVDVDAGGTVGADGGEEVEGFETVGGVVEFFAVAGEEDGAGAGTVADADDVTLVEGGGVGGAGEGLVVAALAEGGVGDGVFVVACGGGGGVRIGGYERGGGL